ncbi:uncharacterized protein BYT42DRAFT_613579 [Radiomyces spectabilis]|uniref:uncharacterized protein n=1 Tax=Radiomyces spectabilis TaxID=64574 RepID=UPI002220B451|nr:uncharacterized protein BYT42DRAFT_613579 [Radiomyces spectabilis]KAI8379249.1 hypothetical protein BYT42DRAFT_613579 [Radiomyces spectabilis]
MPPMDPSLDEYAEDREDDNGIAIGQTIFTMGDKRNNDVWDDTELIECWDQAMREYREYHSQAANETPPFGSQSKSQTKKPHLENAKRRANSEQSASVSKKSKRSNKSKASVIHSSDPLLQEADDQTADYADPSSASYLTYDHSYPSNAAPVPPPPNPPPSFPSSSSHANPMQTDIIQDIIKQCNADHEYDTVGLFHSLKNNRVLLTKMSNSRQMDIILFKCCRSYKQYNKF